MRKAWITRLITESSGKQKSQGAEPCGDASLLALKAESLHVEIINTRHKERSYRRNNRDNDPGLIQSAGGLVRDSEHTL